MYTDFKYKYDISQKHYSQCVINLILYVSLHEIGVLFILHIKNYMNDLSVLLKI